jgi:secreted PhoX family phosphatase
VQTAHGNLSRRDFLGLTGGAAATLALLGPARAFAGANNGPYGDLVSDPGGMLDLPHGFQYRVLSPEGATLRNKTTSGIPVPGDFDGMAAFAGPGNTTVLVRNHEVQINDAPPVVGVNPYDATDWGGTTAVVVAPNRKEVDAYVANSGTRTNCAGGATPWGTWITCEETLTESGEQHGYCFEVMPDDPENNLSKTPITAMGFFSHESIDVDPGTGIVYLTEDSFAGSIPSDPNTEVDSNPAFRSSFLFRYRPNDRSQRPGALLNGGTLQALAIDGVTRNADLYNPGQAFAVRWVTVSAANAHADALANGAVRFTRLEGSHFAGGAFWFDDTQGGEARRGQIYRLIPGPENVVGADTLELVFESTNANDLDLPDNLVVTPWGDLWLTEDGDGSNRIVGLTPEGATYVFAQNRLPGDNELCGPTFAPNGQTFFVNVQDPGVTFAIWGPFARHNRARQRVLAHSAPANQYSPRISGELGEAAERYGLTRLEAAAYDRLGVPLL